MHTPAGGLRNNSERPAALITAFASLASWSMYTFTIHFDTDHWEEAVDWRNSQDTSIQGSPMMQPKQERIGVTPMTSSTRMLFWSDPY